MSGPGTPAAREAAALSLVGATLAANLEFLRRTDPPAAEELEQLRGTQPPQPGFAVVGETKRGKSSLVNALLGVPDLSPVGAAVATSSYLELRYGDPHAARAHVPGTPQPVALDLADLRDWGSALGRLPDGVRPPRRIEVLHSAPLLRYLTLVDTPGVGGLDPLHAQIALDAVGQAAALLFVADAASPLSRPELDFLIEASKRVDFVVFALTKVDAYPGWRTILADNQTRLRAHAPRFAEAPWFPVSARLAELAGTVPADAAAELVAESRIDDLRHALVELAGRGRLLAQSNLLRAVRSEIVRMDQELGVRLRATDPDAAGAGRARRQRAALAAAKRTESRQWSLSLNTETQRARVEATALLRQYLGQLQEEFLNRIERGGAEQRSAISGDVDRALQALSIRLSEDLRARFRQVGERVLAQVFTADELTHVLGGLNARLRHALSAKPRREATGSDNAIVVVSSAGMAMMAGRYGVLGASALGLAGAGLIIPVVGVGLGLGVGAFMVWKRRAMADRQQQRGWLREVLAEARAALSDEIAHRFTDLQYALTLALDDAIERRLAQLDAHIADIDRALAEDAAARARRRATVAAQREALHARLTQVDEVLVRIRQLAPAAPTPATG